MTKQVVETPMTSGKNGDYQTWVEVDLEAIRDNYRAILDLTAQRPVQESLCVERLPEKRNSPGILPVIKADAYGHGMLKVAGVLSELGVNMFAVSDVPDGIILRDHGINKTILMLECVLPDFVKEIVDYRLTPTVCSIAFASALNRYAKKVGRRIEVHINVDTGMSRFGVWHEEAEELIKRIMKFSNLTVEGLYTHFPVADTDRTFTHKQIKIISDLVMHLNRQGKSISYVHAANSMGLADFRRSIFNLVRPGLMLYGLYPGQKLKSKIRLKPAISVKTKIVFVKNITKGRGVSYGHTFVAPRDMTVATLPIGYSDGYFRCFSNNAEVLIGGRRCPVVGRVTMDQIMVDVSQVKNAKVGLETVVLGFQGNSRISADDLAKWAETINYEIVCSLGNRLPRVYISSEGKSEQTELN